MRRRLRYDQEMNLVARFIFHLVRRARWNPEPFSRTQNNGAATHFHKGLAREHVEELLRVMVEVANLRRARRHALLNYAQPRILYQVPAIAVAAPVVVLGGFFADRTDFLTIHNAANTE